MSSLINTNNNACQFEELPTEILFTVLSLSPKETACVMPYVSKMFRTLSNENGLWNSISIKYRTKHLKLNLPFDYNNSKLSYLMRNREIADLFINNRFPGKDANINVYAIDPNALDELNHELNIGQMYFGQMHCCIVFSPQHSTLKTMQFMLDFCHNPSIQGYLAEFIEDDNAINLIMREYQTILEKEYKKHKIFIDKLDLHRSKNNITRPKKLNSLESVARSLINTYETALQIYEKSLS